MIRSLNRKRLAPTAKGMRRGVQQREAGGYARQSSQAGASRGGPPMQGAGPLAAEATKYQSRAPTTASPARPRTGTGAVRAERLAELSAPQRYTRHGPAQTPARPPRKWLRGGISPAMKRSPTKPRVIPIATSKAKFGQWSCEERRTSAKRAANKDEEPSRVHRAFGARLGSLPCQRGTRRTASRPVGQKSRPWRTAALSASFRCQRPTLVKRAAP